MSSNYPAYPSQRRLLGRRGASGVFAKECFTFLARKGENSKPLSL